MTEKEYVQFEVGKEDWSTFRLSDGTVLKVKFVLQYIRLLDGGQAALSSQTIVVPEAPANLRGPTGPPTPYPADKIAASIVATDLKAEQITSVSSVYVTEDHRVLAATPKVKRVRRSSLYDANGDPIYQVETEVRVELQSAPQASESHPSQ